MVVGYDMLGDGDVMGSHAAATTAAVIISVYWGVSGAGPDYLISKGKKMEFLGY